jgi:DNA-sulfur modification-associated
MYESKDNLPTPIGTLESLLDQGDTSAKPHKVFIAHNLGNRAFLISVPMHDFYAMSAVANERGANGEPVAQRKLDEVHAHKLASYILKGLVSAALERRLIQKKSTPDTFLDIQKTLGKQPYMALQPIVANIRTCDPGGAKIPGYRMVTRDEETACFKVMLSQRDILWVVDGQHRRKAMDLVFDFLNSVRTQHKYPRKATLFPSASGEATVGELELWNECLEVARGFCTITVEVHLGLGIEEERQLFHDLNRLAKKVDTSLALQFDSSNPINLFIKEVLFDDIFSWEPIEKDVVSWSDDAGQMTRKDIVAVNAHLFLNKTNTSGAAPSEIDPKKEVATQFWQKISEISEFGSTQAKLKTVAAQPVVLKALGKLTYDFAFGKRRDESASEHLETLFSGIPKLDFSHSNPMWRYYDLTAAEREEANLQGLRDYLPSEDQGYNRDIGKYDQVAKVMRFGSKHNDIYPIIADMVRWKLGLPNRNMRG